MYEHTLVMEKMLGRRMMENESVHHINGIRTDNQETNLELWTRPQPSGIRAVDAYKYAKEVVELYESLAMIKGV